MGTPENRDAAVRATVMRPACGTGTFAPITKPTMRHLSVLLLAALLPALAQGAILRVNNTGVPAPYTSVSAAMNAAQNGDTIHLEASPINYGTLTLTKRLVIIGPGYFLDVNQLTQSNANSARMDWVSFSTGSEGSVIFGVVFNSNTTINRSNVRIERCRFMNNVNFYSSSPLNNVQLVGSYVHGDLTVQGGSQPITNATIANNIFLGRLTASANMSGEFVHNTVRNASADPAFTLSNMVVRNNIFDCVVTPGNNTFMHNLFRTAPVPATNGNMVNVDMSDMFVGGTADGQWRLASGAAAIGAADDGSDCGAYGGSAPYRMSGVPPIPSIIGLTAPHTVDLGAPLPVTLSARTNN
jgi:hypothetical protein